MAESDDFLNQPDPGGLASWVGCWLVVAFQRGVPPGAVDDHAGFAVVAHFLECERAANHVAGEALPAFGIGGLGTDSVMDRKA